MHKIFNCMQINGSALNQISLSLVSAAQIVSTNVSCGENVTTVFVQIPAHAPITAHQRHLPPTKIESPRGF